MILYRLAPELAGPCRQLIGEHHQHLIDANLAYMFRSGKWLHNGRPRMGQTIISPPVWRTLTGYDLVLIVNEDSYISQPDKKKLAMLDNLLSYFSPPKAGPDGLVYATRQPDIQEFSDVVRRRKMCFSNLPSLPEPGTVERVEFTEYETDDQQADIGGELVLDDADDDNLLIVENYEDIDDTGCTVTPLVSFDQQR